MLSVPGDVKIEHEGFADFRMLQDLNAVLINAEVSLRLENKTILGPLGYVFKGAFWVVDKLFVIQE